MELFEITYKGTGSAKQVKWATDIFNNHIDSLKKEYEYVIEHCRDADVIKAWEMTLSNPNVLGTFNAYASQPARTTLDYKGFRAPNDHVISDFLSIATMTMLDTYEKLKVK
jgi:hypothetical protein